MKRISICIPLYNREEYISLTLNSIIKQVETLKKNDVEICISDNCSTDRSGEICEKYAKQYDCISYSRNKKNLGADKNYYNSISMASGDYCWLLGSDDTIEDGAIEYMLNEINKEEDISIFYLNNYDCDVELNKLSVRVQPIENQDIDKTYINSLECAREIGAMFGYISVLIFQKKAWDNISNKEKFIGTAYVHVHWVYEILKAKENLKYISKPLVNWRGGNDSFLLEGIFKRIVIDIDGYNKISKYVFGNDSREAEEINKYVMENYIYQRIYSINTGQMKIIWNVLHATMKVYKYYYYYWIKLIPILLVKMPIRNIVMRLK